MYTPTSLAITVTAKFYFSSVGQSLSPPYLTSLHLLVETFSVKCVNVRVCQLLPSYSWFLSCVLMVFIRLSIFLCPSVIVCLSAFIHNKFIS